MWFFSPRKLVADSVKDEMMMMVTGLMGVSVYFIFENTALEMNTLLSNVSLLVATAPVWTALLSKIIYPKLKTGANMWIGTFVALAGCAFVIFNGRFSLDISNPAGFALSLAAAMSWATYSLVIKNLSNRYESTFITRKVFFWGVVTAIPFMYIPLTGTGRFNFAALAVPEVWGNLLFLGLVASLACYALWNVVINKLGMVKSSNYLYLSPAFTIIASRLFQNEAITWVAIGGFLLIIGGLWIAEHGFRVGFKKKP
jgi:drug/metabolite transporter (DMT)-like permease